MKKVYVPRMENVRENEVLEAWQDWGEYETKKEARAVCSVIQQEIDNGEWTDREAEGYTLQMATEVHDYTTYELIEII